MWNSEVWRAFDSSKVPWYIQIMVVKGREPSDAAEMSKQQKDVTKVAGDTN